MEKTSEKPKKLHPTEKSNFYPKLVIRNNAHPDSLYALPLVGLIIKLIILIPVGIVFMLIGLVFGILWLITPFVILFTGKYWNTAAEFALGYMTYKTKIVLFIMGLTDQYPGFTMETNGIFEIEMKQPTAPNRWFAAPVIGLVIRLVLLIPYSIYQSVLSFGTFVSLIAASFAILVKGKYPESLYEFNRDSIRVSLGYTMYLAYLSDEYPSFWISFKHKSVKIILLILGALLYLASGHRDTRHAGNQYNRQPKMQEHIQQPYQPTEHNSPGY